VAEGRVRDVGYGEFGSGGDEVVGFVEGFKGGVFGLDGVDFGDLRRVSKLKADRLGEIVLEFAFRSVLAEHSERPMYLVLPDLRHSSSAGMDSSSGVLGSMRWR